MAKAQAVLKQPQREQIQDPAHLEDIQEDRDLKRRQQDIEDRNRADKISKLIGNANYLINARPTNILPREKLQKLTGEQLMALPKWYFSRFYMALGIVVDLFVTEKEYTDSDVEARRAWCKKNGFKYGALGPGHRLHDLAPQLDIK